MGFFYQNFSIHQCSLCGEHARLTGEHKIKASALRRVFGETKLYIFAGRTNSNVQPKLAQSTRSKHLKFDVSICENCNTSRTQQADLEFDKFNKTVQELFKQGKDPSQVFKFSRYREGSKEYLDVFRYFAKLLCCHIRQINGPLPKKLSHFVMGKNNKNCVRLGIQNDYTYNNLLKPLGIEEYAAHGGLIINGHKSLEIIQNFHSTLTIGPIQYFFFTSLDWVEKLELKFLYPDFYKWCQVHIEEAKRNPMSREEKKKFGLIY
jgi:hypothetical protein